VGINPARPTEKSANQSNMNTQQETKVAEFNNAWKGRGSLRNLVDELKRQKDTRFDFVSDLRHLNVQEGTNCLLLGPQTPEAGEWLPDGPIPFNAKAAGQLGDKCDPKIPRKFFDAMLEKRAGRLVQLINGLHTDNPSKRLVRCLDGKVRAWLSDSYRILDNFDLAFTCMDAAQRVEAQVLEANLSDTHMRIKFTTQSVWDKVDITQRSGPQGGWFAGALGNRDLQGQTILGATIRDELPGGPGTVHPIVTVGNSETGHGGLHVRIGILMGICFNVATLEDVITQIHLGERMEEGIFSQDTIATDSKAIMMKARDAVLAAFDQEKFKAMVAKAKKAQSDTIDKPSAAVDHLIEASDINQEHKEALLEYFLKDYDQTRFGLAQAVSRLAQDIEDPDAAHEMERIAGNVIKNPSLAKVEELVSA